jgi:hypothetical protein
MDSTEDGSVPGQASAHQVTMAAGSRPRPNPQVCAIALAFGFIAGLSAWVGGELTYGLFRPRLLPTVVMGVSTLQPSAQTLHAADSKNGALAFGLLGCLTGLAMGIGGGVAGRAPLRGVVVGVGAMILGGLVGAGASLALIPFFFQGLVPDPSDLLTPVMVHAGIWGAIGAVGGLAFAIGMSRWRQLPDAIIGACIGSALATILFHCCGEMLFPESSSTQPLASWSTVRLMAMLLVSLAVALGAVWGTISRSSAESTR